MNIVVEEKTILKVGNKSDRGRLREINEDCLYVDEKKGLFMVADGVGGHKAGRAASHFALEIIRDYLDNLPILHDEQEVRNSIKDAIIRANEEIWRKGSWYRELNNMGTTVVVALVKEGKLYISHIGDSRAYLLREKILERLTEDHSVIANIVQEGRLTEEEAKHHLLRHEVNRALGKEEAIEVDVMTYRYGKDNTFLLCTDGLTDLVKDEEIKSVLLSLQDPQQVCDHLIDRANQEGGTDNITVIVVRNAESKKEI